MYCNVLPTAASLFATDTISVCPVATVWSATGERPNAGSVFRNPPGDYAARLIEACGLKGRSIGGARISPKHANFIVNEGGASAADIEALIVLAERSVQGKFGVALAREVRIVGEK